MKCSVYVLKCEHEKFYVGFSTRELYEYFEIIKEGKGTNFSRIHKPLNIISIGTFESIEEAKEENVKVYEILANVLGKENVGMDERRYHEVKGCPPSNSQELDRIDVSNNQKCLEGGDTSINQSPSENILRDVYIVYCLLCDRNARYIGMTKEFSKTFQLHERGEMGSFTKAYKPKEIEFKDYFENEIDAKIIQIEILDKLRVKYGHYIKIYSEFIDSKPDKRVVWEDIIPPADVELFENTPIGPKIKFWVYVLQLEESKYYVGYTSNLRKRFKDHASGSGGSNQTYYYTPISVLHIEGHENARSAQEAEKNWTLDLKKLKGKNNVKGYWAKTNEPPFPAYFAHELLDNWEIKNSKAFEI